MTPRERMPSNDDLYERPWRYGWSALDRRRTRDIELNIERLEPEINSNNMIERIRPEINSLRLFGDMIPDERNSSVERGPSRNTTELMERVRDTLLTRVVPVLENQQQRNRSGIDRISRNPETMPTETERTPEEVSTHTIYALPAPIPPDALRWARASASGIAVIIETMSIRTPVATDVITIPPIVLDSDNFKRKAGYRVRDVRNALDTDIPGLKLIATESYRREHGIALPTSANPRPPANATPQGTNAGTAYILPFPISDAVERHLSLYSTEVVLRRSILAPQIITGLEIPAGELACPELRFLAGITQRDIEDALDTNVPGLKLITTGEYRRRTGLILNGSGPRTPPAATTPQETNVETVYILPGRMSTEVRQHIETYQPLFRSRNIAITSPVSITGFSIPTEELTCDMFKSQAGFTDADVHNALATDVPGLKLIATETYRREQGIQRDGTVSRTPPAATTPQETNVETVYILPSPLPRDARIHLERNFIGSDYPTRTITSPLAINAVTIPSGEQACGQFMRNAGYTEADVQNALTTNVPGLRLIATESFRQQHAAELSPTPPRHNRRRRAQVNYITYVIDQLTDEARRHLESEATTRLVIPAGTARVVEGFVIPDNELSCSQFLFEAGITAQDIENAVLTTTANTRFVRRSVFAEQIATPPRPREIDYDGESERTVKVLKAMAEKYQVDINTSLDLMDHCFDGIPHYGYELESYSEGDKITICFDCGGRNNHHTGDPAQLNSLYGFALSNKGPAKFVRKNPLTSTGAGTVIYDPAGIPVAEVVAEQIFILVNVDGYEVSNSNYWPYDGIRRYWSHNGEVLEKILDEAIPIAIQQIKIQAELPQYIRKVESRKRILAGRTAGAIEALVKSDSAGYERRVVELQRRAEDSVAQADRALREYTQLQNQAVENQHALNILLANPNTDGERIAREINNILLMPQVIGIDYEDNALNVYTDTVYIEWQGKTYRIGSFKISIGRSVTFQNLTNSNRTSSRGTHPHIKDNYPCFGNITEAVAKMLAEKEYEMLLNILVQFLHTYTVNDKYFAIEEWAEKEEVSA